MEHIAQLTNLAFQFGPFLFALLFSLVITRWAYKIYKEANQRKDPPATDKEKETYRFYFFGTAGFGIILVMAAIIWWFGYQTSLFVFRGEISNLKEFERITSNTLYFKRVLLEKLFPNLPQKRDEHFMVVQEKPFEEGQIFKIIYCKDGGDEVEFPISYTSGSTPKYLIEYDTTNAKMVLKKENPLSAKNLLFILNSAFAQEVKPLQNDANSILKKMDSQFDQNLISLLQSEFTPVGRKISILDELNKLSDALLKKYIETSTPIEHMITTLMDLSRHTDRELAYKAERLIKERFDIEIYILRKLNTNPDGARREIERILLRMERKNCEKMLQKISAATNISWIMSLQNDIKTGNKKPRALIPTGSSYSDRYYVEVRWDTKNTEVSSCLFELFSQAVVPFSTTKEKEEFAKVHGIRTIYASSKMWALSFAESVESCGGRASFVGF